MTSSCLQNEYHLGDLIFPSLIISVGYNLSHFWAKYWSDDPEEQLLRIFCLNDVGLLLIIAVSSASIYKYQLFQLSRAFTLVSFQTSNYIIKCLLFLLDILIIFCLRKWVVFMSSATIFRLWSLVTCLNWWGIWHQLSSILGTHGRRWEEPLQVALLCLNTWICAHSCMYMYVHTYSNK